jgi:hypothetical protein
MTTRSLPGVHVTRRSVLELPALAALLPVFRSASRSREGGALTFAEFTERSAAIATQDDAGFPEARLLRLAELAARLDPTGVPRPELGAFGGYEPQICFGPIHRSPGLFLIEWHLEPGAVLPPHNHTPVHVLSLCLEGECWVEHFEIVGDAPAPGAEGAFRMRTTHAQLLRPGRASSLTPERDNIHTFRAGPQGALGIDVNVSIPGKGDWSMIEHRPEDVDGYQRVHRARWIGKP